MKRSLFCLVLAGLLIPALACDRVRGDERTQEAAIIAVSALSSDPLRAMAFEAGCDSYLVKPVLGAAIVGELMRVLVQRRTRADMSRLKR